MELPVATLYSEMYRLILSYPLQGQKFTDINLAARALALCGYDPVQQGESAPTERRPTFSGTCNHIIQVLANKDFANKKRADLAVERYKVGLGVFGNVNGPTLHKPKRKTAADLVDSNAKASFCYYTISPTELLAEFRTQLQADLQTDISPSKIKNFLDLMNHLGLITQIGSAWGIGTSLMSYSHLDSSIMMRRCIEDYFKVDSLNQVALAEATIQRIADVERDRAWNDEIVKQAEIQVAKAQEEKQQIANELEIYSSSTWT